MNKAAANLAKIVAKVSAAMGEEIKRAVMCAAAGENSDTEAFFEEEEVKETQEAVSAGPEDETAQKVQKSVAEATARVMAAMALSIAVTVKKYVDAEMSKTD